MLDNRGWHPVLRYGLILLSISAALPLLIISWQCNPHSAAWLLGIFTTTGLFLAALRSARQSALHRSYALYLFMLIQYLTCVWLLHVIVPGGNASAAKTLAGWWAWFFYPGLIFNAQAHLHFAIRFADIRSKWLRFLELSCWAVSIFFFLLNCIGLFAVDYIWAGFTWVPTLDGGYGYFFPFTTFLLTLGLLVPVVKAITYRGDQQRRLQLIYYILGAAPVWICCWGNFLISWGLNIYPAGGVMFLLHVAIIGYAVFWHRLFDFTIIIRRGLAYAAVSLLLGLLYGTIIWVGANWTELRLHGIGSSILFVMFAGITVAPLLNYFQKLIDQFFCRENTQRQKLLESLARETASTVQLAKISEVLCRSLDQTFHPIEVSLYLKNDSDKEVLFGRLNTEFVLEEWPNSQELPSQFQKCNTEAQLFKTGDLEVRRQPQIQFDVEHETLQIPIIHRSERLGCLLVEAKKADEPFTSEDLKFAETIAAQSASALLNARSYSQLEQLQTLTSRTFEELLAGVMLIAQSGRILQANRMARRLLPDDATHFPETIEQFWVFQPLLASEIRDLIARCEAVSNKEITINDARKKIYLLSVRPLENERAECQHLVIFHDISEYKEMESIARRREALARVGEAISGINHEIKNVLQPIRYQIDQLASNEQNEKILKRVIKVVPDRLAALDKLLTNLKDLSRPIELRKRCIDISDMIDSIWLDLRDTAMATGVTFENAVSSSHRHCYADGQWLRHVVFNLTKNAVEAIAGRENPLVAISTCGTGNVFQIIVEDNGCGIDEIARARLFEPFFSTKGEGGTGLGLSICQRIVELHGGQIAFFSHPGQGTRVHVSLPLNESVAIEASHNAVTDK